MSRFIGTLVYENTAVVKTIAVLYILVTFKKMDVPAMNKAFFTSDLHLGHAKIIEFDKRPFQSVEEMDAEIILRWNAKVGKGDTVYVLGDMIWKTRKDEALDIINSLNGQKILIKGNHDRFVSNGEVRKAFAAVKDYDEINVTLEDGTSRKCVVSHYFIPLYNGHRDGAIHLHGHSHFTDESQIEIEIVEKLNSLGFSPKIYNVGCMYWNYEPVTLDEILNSNSN